MSNEKPILFKDDMIRAILEGRKTQTRRIMKPQPVIDSDGWFRWDGHKPNSKLGAYASNHIDLQAISIFVGVSCPYGQPGDRLWVRETFQGPLLSYEQAQEFFNHREKFESPRYCQYRADGGPAPVFVNADDEERYGWRPSIHMPRWASRITLEITDVRVERLQDISEEDAEAEGADPVLVPPDGGDYPHRQGFLDLWESIYGQDSWDANPWVWCISFKRIDA